MLRTYSVNLAGPGHVQRGVVCQDACCVETCANVVIAAVADGLGSEAHSEIGSRVAARAAVEACRERLAERGAELGAEAIVREAFAAAYRAVIEESAASGIPEDEMDCTLCLALFDGRRVAFGCAGDSGLIAALDDGRYEPLTSMQRDEEGRVFPLCFEDHWAFGAREGVASILLATDGVLEGLIAPPALARWTDNPVDTFVARGFLHPDLGEGDLAELQRDAEAFLQAVPVELVDDDKTVVVAFDDERPAGLMPEDYYAGPDWEAVAAKASAVLYAPAAPQPAPAGEPAAVGPAAEPVEHRALHAKPRTEGRTVPASAVTPRPVRKPLVEAAESAGAALASLGMGTLAVATRAVGGGAALAKATAEALTTKDVALPDQDAPKE